MDISGFFENFEKNAAPMLDEYEWIEVADTAIQCPSNEVMSLNFTDVHFK